jgi:hypothetical protein
MEIKDLIKTDTTGLQTRFEHKGVTLIVRYVSRSKNQQIARAAMAHPYNKSTGKRQQEMQVDNFMLGFLKAAVVDWEGVTARSLSQIIAIDTKTLTAKQLDEPIKFTTSGLKVLLDEAYELDKELQDFCTNIDNFHPDFEDEVKNSETSQSGS